MFKFKVLKKYLACIFSVYLGIGSRLMVKSQNIDELNSVNQEQNNKIFDIKIKDENTEILEPVFRNDKVKYGYEK